MSELVCRACLRPLEPGEALLCSPRDGTPPFVLHRPQVDGRCLDAAGLASSVAIALYDKPAAAAFDRFRGGPLRRDDRLLANAMKANTERSLPR